MRSLSRSLMFLFVFAWLLYVVDLLNGYVIDRHLLEAQYLFLEILPAGSDYETKWEFHRDLKYKCWLILRT